MGRPSKQKAFVDKYFIKYYAGKTEKRKCIFCEESYAYNAFRLAKHLLKCRKTNEKFQKDKMKIESLFKTTNCYQVNFSSNSSATNTTSAGLGAIIPAFLKNDINDEDAELVVENQDLVQYENAVDSYEVNEQHTPSTSTNTSNNTFYNNDTNRKFTTDLLSKNISKKLNTKLLDGYVDRLINIQEQVIIILI